MLKTVTLPSLNRNIVSLTTEQADLEILGTCPICGAKILPTFKYGTITYDNSSSVVIEIMKSAKVITLFECPNCHEGISVTYKPNYELYNNSISKWKLFKIISVSPIPTATFPFDPIIGQISPKFEKTYTQSLQAKMEQKNELVGIGYRKAIEFLIKDYLINTNHEKKDSVPNMHLGDCIKLIDQSKIQTLAKASTWLGNDETHYVRKHTDKDLQDLEHFINALVYYITYELTVSEALSFISK